MEGNVLARTVLRYMVMILLGLYHRPAVIAHVLRRCCSQGCFGDSVP